MHYTMHSVIQLSNLRIMTFCSIITTLLVDCIKYCMASSIHVPIDFFCETFLYRREVKNSASEFDHLKPQTWMCEKKT